MPQFIGGDVPAYLLQYRLLRRIGDRRVVGAGAGFDNTAGNQLAGTGPTTRLHRIDIETIPLLEPRVGSGQTERGIGKFGIAAERFAMLNFLDSPVSRSLLKQRVIGED